jgi:hypothetical protein
MPMRKPIPTVGSFSMCNDAFRTVWLARVMQLILMLPKAGLSLPMNGGMEQERFPKSGAAPVLTDAGTS